MPGLLAFSSCFKNVQLPLAFVVGSDLEFSSADHRRLWRNPGTGETFPMGLDLPPSFCPVTGELKRVLPVHPAQHH